MVTIVNAAIIYWVLLIALRLVGRRGPSMMTPSCTSDVLPDHSGFPSSLILRKSVAPWSPAVIDP